MLVKCVDPSAAISENCNYAQLYVRCVVRFVDVSDEFYSCLDLFRSIYDK